MLPKLAAVILVFCLNSASGQTVSDIEMTHGRPMNVYSVSEHIWMTPEYTAEGQVCQMRLFPKRIGPDSNYLFPHLPFEELKVVLNQLVPFSARGEKKESFGITGTGGGAAWTTYPYEKVTVIFSFSFRVDPSFRKELKPHDFLVREFLSTRKPEKSLPSDADFLPSQASRVEIVTINWNARQCTKQ